MIVGNKQIAAILAITPQRINQLVRDHGMPQTERGKYDTTVVVPWFIQYQLRVQQEQAKPSTRSEAETRKAQAQAEMLELETAEKRGQLISVEAARRVLADAISATRSKLLAMPRKAATLVIGQTSLPAVESILTDIVHESLTDIAGIPAKIDVAAQIVGTGVGADLADVHAAAAVDGQPMGRRKPAVVRRKRSGKRTLAH